MILLIENASLPKLDSFIYRAHMKEYKNKKTSLMLAVFSYLTLNIVLNSHTLN